MDLPYFDFLDKKTELDIGYFLGHAGNKMRYELATMSTILKGCALHLLDHINQSRRKRDRPQLSGQTVSLKP